MSLIIDLILALIFAVAIANLDLDHFGQIRNTGMLVGDGLCASLKVVFSDERTIRGFA